MTRHRRLLAGLGAALAVGIFCSGAAFAEEAAPCRPAVFESDAFTVCRYAPEAAELRLAWRAPGGRIGSLAGLQRALGPDAARVAFAFNAGMYDPDRRPVGLWVEAGRELRPLDRARGQGNFYLLPNGVFWTDAKGAPHITEAGAFATLGAHPRWATQSGPLLVRAGALHPAIMPNGTSLAVRNGVGVKDGEALFVISERPVSFGRFARFLRDGLGCPDALYFDGSVSSLWAPSLRRMDGRTGLGTFVVVMRK